ncbi:MULTISPECIES: TonB-dependent receptor plug domain-containing protein [unclassified Sphingobacterium]|uniref:TonB-dependent receptor plug domain-containing protein n=1 Tax=unclassified Sphingobacterium TaxID=2609468 RepID=UPI0010435244|nr:MULTISPECIES: TonB-dependent receptor plug domain-containing protein [unclassified Sphingobacterium]MCS3556560.1 hypothetical protein [Sphingobacterium sp. JUb21]TCQ99856.1 outer membrane receptor protein involved in Fe transport [Sphingobacterium sp. JUb20]
MKFICIKTNCFIGCILLLCGWFHATGAIIATDTTIRVNVFGNCDQCKARIEKAISGQGLKEAAWDQQSKSLLLQFDPQVFALEAAIQRLLDAGHDVAGFKSKNEIYEKIKGCCNYRGKDNHGDSHEHNHDHIIKGQILQETENGRFRPIQAANVFWMEDPSKVIRSDQTGRFQILHHKGFKSLIVTHSGLQPDTIVISDLHAPIMVLAKGHVLAEVTVSARNSSTFINKMKASRIETITSKELTKGACCDLAESFETNASVDVVSTDAVTGGKQIQMLGLSGIYTQLTVENLPGPRGLATPLGLNSIAGAWIESIELSKGIGSVVNGFENIAGQINVELKKPDLSERLFLNAYANSSGRSDLNLSLAHRFNERWSGGLLLHDNFMYNKNINFSENGFRDVPVGNLFSGVSRWKYEDGKGFYLHFGIKFLSDNRTGGQVDFDPKTDKLTKNRYGLNFDIERYEAFTKIGYLFPNNEYRSIGLQLSGTVFNQKSYFGLRTYDAKQNNGYANLIYQDLIGDSPSHKYRTGLSLLYDRYDEDFRMMETTSIAHFKRAEIVPGGFVEYTFSPNEKFDAVLGLRGDYNSLYGWFATPRGHIRYQPVSGTTLRLSSGRGQRTANIFAENTAALASSRMVNILVANSNEKAYGLLPEVAWNTGFSFDQSFRIFDREASYSIELFRNTFTNQVVVDYENPRELAFYNLKGKSFSNSMQTELKFMPMPHFEARMAYRFFDVKTTYGDQLLERPLLAKHRGFLNLAYSTHGTGWSFDYTLSATGQKRLPSTASNPLEYQLPDYSRAFVTMNAQVSKIFGKERPFTFYVGGENLTNFFQPNPVLAADQPFSSFFDTSLLWGPITGRLFYAGVRYSIQ